MKLSDKDKAAKIREVIELYELEVISIKEACARVKIDRNTFYNAIAENGQFRQEYKEADERRAKNYRSHVKGLAENSIKKLLEGAEEETEEIVGTYQTNADGERVFVPKSVKRVKRKLSPHAAVSIFVAKNTFDDFNAENEHKIGIDFEDVNPEIAAKILDAIKPKK